LESRHSIKESPSFGKLTPNRLRINEDSPEKKRLDEEDEKLKQTFS